MFALNYNHNHVLCSCFLLFFISMHFGICDKNLFKKKSLPKKGDMATKTQGVTRVIKDFS